MPLYYLLEVDFKSSSILKNTVFALNHENLSSVPRLKNKTGEWRCVLVLPAMGEWRQAVPWDLLVIQPGLIGELQDTERSSPTPQNGST